MMTNSMMPLNTVKEDIKFAFWSARSSVRGNARGGGDNNVASRFRHAAPLLADVISVNCRTMLTTKTTATAADRNCSFARKHRQSPDASSRHSVWQQVVFSL